MFHYYLLPSIAAAVVDPHFWAAVSCNLAPASLSASLPISGSIASFAFWSPLPLVAQ